MKQYCIQDIRPIQIKPIPWGWENQDGWVIKPRGEIVMPHLIDYFDWNDYEVNPLKHLEYQESIIGTTAMKSVFTTACRFLGMQEAMIQLHTGELTKGLAQISNEMLIWNERLIEACILQITIQGDEIGSSRGMMISPELYRQHLKPIHKQFAELFNNAGIEPWYHSDGDISAVLSDLKAIGFVGIYYEDIGNMKTELIKSDLKGIEVVRNV